MLLERLSNESSAFEDELVGSHVPTMADSASSFDPSIKLLSFGAGGIVGYT
jgi:hypothetical protein